MANPGYGKRSAPDQLPYRSHAFDHLPPRERYIAAFIDRLPDGAAMDAKTLAKALPLFGQQAVRTALNELSRTGHLRRVRRRAQVGGNGEGGDGVTRWVFRTCWSRTARDSEWWARFLAGDVPSAARPETSAEACAAPATPAAPGDVSPHEPKQAEEADGGEGGEGGDGGDQAEQVHGADRAEPAPQAEALRLAGPPRPSLAYETLAQLGRVEPRLVLSAADCAALEELASDWLVRGATPASLTQALVAGLPEPVHSPRALVQRRLRDKMPPELPDPEERPALRAPLMMECTDCRVPGDPKALPGGLCRACRGGTTVEAPPALSAAAVHVRAAQVREAIRMPVRV